MRDLEHARLHGAHHRDAAQDRLVFGLGLPHAHALGLLHAHFGQSTYPAASHTYTYRACYKYYGIERPWALSRTTSNAALSLGLTNYINA